MKECKSCNIELEDEHRFCPKCGQPLSEKESIIESLEISKKEEKNQEIPLTEKESRVVNNKKQIGIYLGWFLTLSPFFITGFSFFFIWYVLIGVVLFLLIALWGCDSKYNDDKDVVNTVLVVYIVIAIFMIIWGPINPNY